MKNKSNKLNMTWVPIQSLNPAPYNPRDISDRAFEGLKESIKKFGFVDPIIVNKRSGNIIGGHQRLKAAQSLEMTDVPVVEIDVGDIEEKALNVTLNNQSISGFYTDTLQDLLAEVSNELEDFNDLLLNDLIIQTDWSSDNEAIDDIDENLDGLQAKFSITCDQKDKDDLLVELTKLVKSFAGAELKC